MITVLGDMGNYLRYKHRLDNERQVLASDHVRLSEVIAEQLPRVQSGTDAIIVYLGAEDISDGHDESYFHARIVELCDNLKSRFVDRPIKIVALPAGSGRVEEGLLRACNAAAENAAMLRAIDWGGV